MTNPGENPNDESFGLANRFQVLDLLRNFCATAASSEPSSKTLGETSDNEPSVFDCSGRTLDLQRNFSPVAASCAPPSSTTRLSSQNRGPSVELTLGLPSMKQPKKKFYRSKLPPLPNPPPNLPQVFRQHIASLGGQEVQLVMQKVLTCSDLSSHLARLLLPEKQIQRGMNFLRTDECDGLHTDKDKEIIVGVISSNLVEKMLKLKLWSMCKKSRSTVEREPSINYVLQGGWVWFARENDLKENDWVQLWSFRVNDGTHHDALKFAIVNLRGH